MQHRDHRIIVIGLHQIYRIRSDRCVAPQRIGIHCPASAPLNWIVGEAIVPLDRGQHACAWQAKRGCPRSVHHQKTLRAGAGHHAVEQVQWRSDGTRGQIRLHRQFIAHQRQWIALRPSPLRDAQLAEVLARRARAAHRMVGEQRKTCVRTTGAVWPDEVAGEAAELRDQIVETVGPLVSPAMQATTSASPHWTARAARRSAMTPQAPPVGKNSRKRGESPTYCTNGAGPSGAQREAGQA